MKKILNLLVIATVSLILVMNVASAQVNSFSSPDGAYSVSYPKDFQLEYEKADTTAKITNEGLLLYISISRFPDTQETAPSLEAGVNESIKETQKDGFKLIGIQNYPFKNYPGKRVQFTQTDKNQVIQVDYFYIAVKKSLYLIVVSSTQELFAQNFAKVKPILDSMQFKF